MSAPHLFPANVKRADRLQQLINHIGILQGDIVKEKRRMEQLDKASQTLLDELLKNGDIPTLKELQEKAMTQLSEKQRREFQDLIDSTKTVHQAGETMFWIALVLGGPEIAKFSGPAIMSLFGKASSMQAIQGSIYALVETLTQATAQTAQAAGKSWSSELLYLLEIFQVVTFLSGVANAAEKATSVAKAGESAAAAAGAESAQATKTFGFLGKYAKWFSRLGVVLLVAVPLVELFIGAKQKERLIEGINETQVARLVVRSLREEARTLTEQMTSFKTYLDMLKKGKKAEAQEFGDELLETIRTKISEVDLEKLQDELEKSDRQSANYYGDDDLGASQVVELALKRQDGEEKGN
ncbi:hypothetical protein VNI00_013630 [Paramarasmius palmivorus]|uniref:Uncharacterized protein n=1 Tax=Paramarasmius palmivorus TaxID=297713 RepID=A0AAW0BY69_9AGAR